MENPEMSKNSERKLLLATVTEARKNLGKLVDRALDSECVVIRRKGRFVRLVPVNSENSHVSVGEMWDESLGPYEWERFEQPDSGDQSDIAYFKNEYGLTEEEMENAGKRMKAIATRARKSGKLRRIAHPGDL